jgi:pimeloyl-ACP methyl ester carboxylesterase
LIPFRSALTFILAQQRGRTPARITVRKETIRSGKVVFSADVYSPASVQKNPIVFLHGMSPLGIHDPRQVIAVNALAATGFRVICPELPEIKDLKITASSINAFVSVVAAICKDPNLCPSGRAALFAPSFSGAICLKAASMPQLVGRVSAICALGSMAQVRGSMEYLFLSDEADTYARYIVLSNYLPLVKKYQALAPVFAAMARDNWNYSASKNPHLTGYTPTDDAAKIIKKLTPKNRECAIALQKDVAYRKEVFAELTPYMETELQAYDIVSVAEKIAAPTLLMHGQSDNVIPPGESLRLAPHLKRVKLVISPFLGHADTKVSLKLIPDVFRLVSGFAYFFRHAAR